MIFLVVQTSNADVAQQVARILGKDEVGGSSPLISFIQSPGGCRGIFYIIGKFSELSYDIKILCASRSEEIIASQSARARQKCASCQFIEVARMCEAHFCSIIIFRYRKAFYINLLFFYMKLFNFSKFFHILHTG